jgi:hypothetical protein
MKKYIKIGFCGLAPIAVVRPISLFHLIQVWGDAAARVVDGDSKIAILIVLFHSDFEI